MTHLFDVIIPTLNEEQRIALILGDIAAQTLPPHQVIIVDAQSTDKTLEEVAKFSKQLPIKVIQTSTRNPGAQRNLAAQQAKAQFLIFLDADARIPADYFERIWAQIKPSDHIIVTWSIPDTKRIFDRFYIHFYNATISFLKNILPSANGSGMIIRRDTFRELGGFRTLSFAEDNEFVRRARRHGYHLTILHDPKITWCLRRFRSEGYFQTFFTWGFLFVYYFFRRRNDMGEKLYKMGGTLDEKPNLLQ